ncbi:OsmC family protein [Rhodoferax aquaticus]|uniref:OsmC family peroxiredoxin n=1 Tax=Rhodoferax aquaticus TaxID=2527691 RepID=A0A515EPC6_9BURK|nr:OsmC family protein [Rhodoferax aquaticus]QDL54499.1 OsmC family peroxiredoxin [Rhodoferax aquaticus]
MSISIQRQPGTVMAQSLRLRSHTLVSDVSVSEGGEDLGPSPHDLYDAALGACKALTVMWYTKKKGMAVTDVQSVVDSDKSQERTGVYRIHANLMISGDISDAEFDQLAAVAEKCPVHKLMTVVQTEITTHVERAA